MAELNVQPKKSSNWWIWLLLLAIAIAAILYFSKGCNETNENAAIDTLNNDVTAMTTPADTNEWSGVDFNAPATNYDEITDKDVNVRGNDRYAIYSLGENILFAVGASTLQNDATPKLQQIAASLNKRFSNGKIRVYGHTDSTGSAGLNKQIAEQRAASVKDWLVKNTNIPEDNFSLEPVGESRPLASNETAAGRQQNRSVEIVVMQSK